MKRTKTSHFGVSKREGHDSRKFYSTKLYANYDIKEEKEISSNQIDAKYLNKIICHDSRDISFLPDNSIHLVITSPPYSVTKEYDDNLSLNEYLKLIEDVMSEMYRILIRGGRLCLNIANIGRKPYIPLNSLINQIMINLGFFMRGEVIWNKAASAGTSTAWGSFTSASNPTLRDVHEYVMIYSKEQFSSPKNNKENTISKEDFLELTKSIWSFPTESAKRIGHPAPFPIELPRRCIELYSYKNDIILDPFIGSGTTCLAALRQQRKFIGIDISKDYCQLAGQRLKNEMSQKKLSEFL
ncbi:MAG: DNA-methyltransferase [Candidatus Hodarchaeales archaeon]|jgi:site-specific DNA-methyltransferase (adenine-specific)